MIFISILEQYADNHVDSTRVPNHDLYDNLWLIIRGQIY